MSIKLLEAELGNQIVANNIDPGPAFDEFIKTINKSEIYKYTRSKKTGFTISIKKPDYLFCILAAIVPGAIDSLSKSGSYKIFLKYHDFNRAEEFLKNLSITTLDGGEVADLGSFEIQIENGKIIANAQNPNQIRAALMQQINKLPCYDSLQKINVTESYLAEAAPLAAIKNIITNKLGDSASARTKDDIKRDAELESIHKSLVKSIINLVKDQCNIKSLTCQQRDTQKLENNIISTVLTFGLPGNQIFGVQHTGTKVQAIADFRNPQGINVDGKPEEDLSITCKKLLTLLNLDSSSFNSLDQQLKNTEENSDLNDALKAPNQRDAIEGPGDRMLPAGAKTLLGPPLKNTLIDQILKNAMKINPAAFKESINKRYSRKFLNKLDESIILNEALVNPKAVNAADFARLWNNTQNLDINFVLQWRINLVRWYIAAVYNILDIKTYQAKASIAEKNLYQLFTKTKGLKSYAIVLVEYYYKLNDNFPDTKWFNCVDNLYMDTAKKYVDGLLGLKRFSNAIISKEFWDTSMPADDYSLILTVLVNQNTFDQGYLDLNGNHLTGESIFSDVPETSTKFGKALPIEYIRQKLAEVGLNMTSTHTFDSSFKKLSKNDVIAKISGLVNSKKSASDILYLAADCLDGNQNTNILDDKNPNYNNLMKSLINFIDQSGK